MVVVLALLLGLVGYAAIDHRAGSSSLLPPASAPPATGPTTPGGAPATAPTTPPSTEPDSAGSGVSTSTTALNVGVVDVNTDLGYQRRAAAGTGIVLSPSGEILTNNHVIDDSTSITVTVVTTGQTYKAEVAGTNPGADVALLRLVDASGLDVAKLGDSAKVQIGDQVTAVGNAGGLGGAPSVNSGTVTALDQAISASDGPGGESEQLTGLIQTNARLQPGDSGGPLYDAAGQVVGMNTAGSVRRRAGAGGSAYFAIPINSAVSIARQIASGAASDEITIGTPGFLGVQLAADDTASGVTVAAIVPGTPAETAGLQEGDVITSVDGHAVDGAKALESVLGRHHGGDTVSVTWSDGEGRQHTESITLAEGPAN